MCLGVTGFLLCCVALSRYFFRKGNAHGLATLRDNTIAERVLFTGEVRATRASDGNPAVKLGVGYYSKTGALIPGALRRCTCWIIVVLRYPSACRITTC